MHLSALHLLVIASLSSASPFKFPLRNGFPFPRDAALDELFTRAGGNFTNMPLAPKFDDDSLISWKLQAFNEFMEVAFFTQLVSNITKRIPGYELDREQESYVLKSLEAIQAQEQLHAYNANDAVRYFADGSHIYPCTYAFPISDFLSAIAFAQTFTDMYIGLLINIQKRTAASLGSYSDSIIYVLSQALGQEGQQSGFFRSLQRKAPSAEPFLTTSTRDFHFSYLQRFILPGSCPNMDMIPLKTFPRLDLAASVESDSAYAEFWVDRLGKEEEVDVEVMRIAYVNGALVPTVVPFEIVTPESDLVDGESGRRFRGGVERVLGWPGRVHSDHGAGEGGDRMRIRARFPYESNVMRGLTIATLVRDDGHGDWGFITAEDVADATVYGPAVIEVE